jgi:hypothetical protein
MRSVCWLCSVVFLGLALDAIFTLFVPMHAPLPIFDGYGPADVFLVWWLYIAPPFTLIAFALPMWKSWMEALSRNMKLGGWLVVGVAAGVNLYMAFEILRG